MELTAYGPLRGDIGGKTAEIAFEGGTVRDALGAFVDAYPRAERHLTDDDGAIRASVRVLVDGDRVDLDDPCPADASLAVVPAVQGGRAR